MYWIINDNIEFIPGMKKLASVNNPEMSVTLTTPASRCLLLLLEASPDVVLQQDFFKKVWEEEGMLVPTNTLYQNISIIRRGLRAVGETDRRLIATIPRKGFQIDDSVKIVRQNDSLLKAPTEVTIVDTQTYDDIAEKPNYDDVNGSIGLPPITEQANNRGNIDKKKSVFFTGLLTTLISFIVGLSLIYLIWNINNSSNFFETYDFVENDNGCHFYTKDESHDNNSYYLRYKSLITKSGLNCKNYPWIYYPTSPTSPTLAALVCKNKFMTTTSPECISLLIRGVNGD